MSETLPKWQMGNMQKGLTRACVFGGPVSAFVLMNTELMAFSLFIVCLFIYFQSLQVSQQSPLEHESQ